MLGKSSLKLQQHVNWQLNATEPKPQSPSPFFPKTEVTIDNLGQSGGQS